VGNPAALRRIQQGSGRRLLDSPQAGMRRVKPFSILEERKDLIPAYIVTVVRNGLHEMAPFRPTEIDDAALSELVAYLAPPRKVSSKQR
jgi:hypothetical protein